MRTLSGAAGNDGVALLANRVAAGCARFVLILVFEPISGAHFNLLVNLVVRFERDASTTALLGFAVTQLRHRRCTSRSPLRAKIARPEVGHALRERIDRADAILCRPDVHDCRRGAIWFE